MTFFRLLLPNPIYLTVGWIFLKEKGSNVCSIFSSISISINDFSPIRSSCLNNFNPTLAIFNLLTLHKSLNHPLCIFGMTHPDRSKYCNFTCPPNKFFGMSSAPCISRVNKLLRLWNNLCGKPRIPFIQILLKAGDDVKRFSGTECKLVVNNSNTLSTLQASRKDWGMVGSDLVIKINFVSEEDIGRKMSLSISKAFLISTVNVSTQLRFLNRSRCSLGWWNMTESSRRDGKADNAFSLKYRDSKFVMFLIFCKPTREPSEI